MSHRSAGVIAGQQAAPGRVGKAPFRGWWIVLICGLGMFVDSGAGGYAFSSLIRPMAEAFGTTTTGMVAGASIGSIVSAIAALLVGPLIDRFGARMSLVVGSFLMTGSILMIARAESLFEFYLFFGVGLGIARPLVGQVAPVAAVANWFFRRRAEAFAMMSLGASTAGVILAPICGLIIASYGWRAAWLFLATLPIVLVAPAAFFIVRKRPEDVGELVDGDPAPVNATSAADREVLWTHGEVVRTNAFWLLLLSQLLMTVTGAGLFIHLAAFAQDYGFGPTLATTFVSVYAAGALSGRALWTWLTRRLGIQGAMVAQAFGWGTGIAILMAVAAYSPILWLFYPVVFGIGAVGGGSIQLRSQAWADYFGRGVIGIITGYSTIAQTVTSATAPLFLGLVRDNTGSYLGGMGVFVGCCYLAGVVLIVTRPPRKRETPRSLY